MQLRTDEERLQKGMLVNRQTPEWRATRAVLGPLGYVEAECCEDCVAEAYGVQPI